MLFGLDGAVADTVSPYILKMQELRCDVSKGYVVG